VAGERVLLATVALCLALRAAASFSASGWLWGLNTFRDWPAPWPILLPALAVVGFLPGPARAASRPLARVGEALAAGGLPIRLLVAAAVAVALFLLRDPLRFTGDSGTRLAMIAGGVDMRPLMPQLSPLDLLVDVGGARWLATHGFAPEVAMQIVGALLGAALAPALLGFLAATGARGSAWAVAAVVCLAGGSLVHLAGYGKYGPLLVGITLSATGIVRLARGRSGAWTLASGLIVALLSHRSAYALLPAGLWALAAAWRRAPREGRRRVALAAGAALLTAVALLPHTAGLLVGYDARVNLVGTSTPGRFEPGRQVANTVNALFLLCPLWPVGAVVAWRLRRHGVRAGDGPFPLGTVTVLALAGELAVSLAARPSQGPLRDWDTQVAAALVVTLATIGLLAAWWGRRGAGRSALPVCATALVAGLALWGIQTRPGIAEHRLATLLADPAAWDREERSRAYEFVGTRAFEAGRFEEAARAYEIVVAGAPSARFVANLAVAQGMAGRTEESERTLARAMSLPQSPVMWVALGRLALTLGDSARARICADSIEAHQWSGPSGGQAPGAGPSP
jgi:hypothetical protein